jgi:hypothetical protein
MSEEVQNVQLTVEQILAAILNKVGKIDLTEEELLADYSSYAVAVDPAGDKTVSFQLVDEGVIGEQQ